MRSSRARRIVALLAKHCLRERRYLSVQAGEGTPAEYRHLRQCADCAERYDALLEDLELIGAVLTAPPPRLSAPAGAFSSRVPRLTVAGAGIATLAVALVAGNLWLRSPVTAAREPANVGGLAEEFSIALLSADDLQPVSATGPDVSDVRAALSGHWPCPWEESGGGECDDDLSALLGQSAESGDWEMNG